MSSRDLYDAFRVDLVDQSELEQLLQSHFRNAISDSPDVVCYSHDGNKEPALTLRYSDDDEIAHIEAGPSLRLDDIPQVVDKITRFLLTATESHIGQVVLFAPLATTKWFRYRDVFQILPVPAEAPRPPFLMGDHPLLLQYKVEGSEDQVISMIRRQRIGRELELLCTALTTYVHGGIGNISRHHWVLTNIENPSEWQSAFLQEMYTWPGANAITQGYGDVSGIDPMDLTPAATYNARIGISAGQVLDLPDNFELLLDTYFASARDDRDRFIRASYWFQYSQRVSNISRSGAFTAYVSAIEALMPTNRPEMTCSECKRPIGIGPTRQFVEFVEQYVPGSGHLAKQRRNLYSLRSALSHGGKLLHRDRHGWGGSLTSASLSNWDDERAMWQVVRLVLVNWLASRNRVV